MAISRVFSTVTATPFIFKDPPYNLLGVEGAELWYLPRDVQAANRWAKDTKISSDARRTLERVADPRHSLSLSEWTQWLTIWSAHHPQPRPYVRLPLSATTVAREWQSNPGLMWTRIRESFRWSAQTLSETQQLVARVSQSRTVSLSSFYAWVRLVTWHVEYMDTVSDDTVIWTASNASQCWCDRLFWNTHPSDTRRSALWAVIADISPIDSESLKDLAGLWDHWQRSHEVPRPVEVSWRLECLTEEHSGPCRATATACLTNPARTLHTWSETWPTRVAYEADHPTWQQMIWEAVAELNATPTESTSSTVRPSLPPPPISDVGTSAATPFKSPIKRGLRWRWTASWPTSQKGYLTLSLQQRAPFVVNWSSSRPIPVRGLQNVPALPAQACDEIIRQARAAFGTQLSDFPSDQHLQHGARSALTFLAQPPQDTPARFRTPYNPANVDDTNPETSSSAPTIDLMTSLQKVLGRIQTSEPQRGRPLREDLRIAAIRYIEHVMTAVDQLLRQAAPDDLFNMQRETILDEAEQAALAGAGNLTTLDLRFFFSRSHPEVPIPAKHHRSQRSAQTSQTSPVVDGPVGPLVDEESGDMIDRSLVSHYGSVIDLDVQDTWSLSQFGLHHNDVSPAMWSWLNELFTKAAPYVEKACAITAATPPPFDELVRCAQSFSDASYRVLDPTSPRMLLRTVEYRLSDELHNARTTDDVLRTPLDHWLAVEALRQGPPPELCLQRADLDDWLTWLEPLRYGAQYTQGTWNYLGAIESPRFANLWFLAVHFCLARQVEPPELPPNWRAVMIDRPEHRRQVSHQWARFGEVMGWALSRRDTVSQTPLFRWFWTYYWNPDHWITLIPDDFRHVLEWRIPDARLNRWRGMHPLAPTPRPPASASERIQTALKNFTTDPAFSHTASLKETAALLDALTPTSSLTDFVAGFDALLAHFDGNRPQAMTWLDSWLHNTPLRTRWEAFLTFAGVDDALEPRSEPATASTTVGDGWIRRSDQ